MSPVKKVISGPTPRTHSGHSHQDQHSADSETIDFTENVDAGRIVTPSQLPVIDPLEAVDINGSPIHVGDTVDIYGCQVIGLRPDPNNRLNLLVIPLNNNIVAPDPSNPLTGQIDGKAILVSGYHCTVVLTPTASGQERAAGIDKMLTKLAQLDANPPKPVQLPSNFLAPSLE